MYTFLSETTQTEQTRNKPNDYTYRLETKNKRKFKNAIVFFNRCFFQFSNLSFKENSIHFLNKIEETGLSD